MEYKSKDFNKLMCSNLNRGNCEKTGKKKLKFKDYKKNTFNSLYEVEYFLNNLDKAFRSFHLYKIFRIS